MNYKTVFRAIGKILRLEAAFLLLPLVVSIIYKEEHLYLAFIIPLLLAFILGTILTTVIKEKAKIYAIDGFAIVSLSWIMISLFGSLPFIISGEIPNFINAFFETVSGFTTTGASILDNVESLSKGLLFWRSFTNWIGGMGILVFVLAFLPTTNLKSINILKAETTGPQIEKIVPSTRLSTRILYSIYIFLTILLMILLLFGGMDIFDSVTLGFSTAGTGGFSINNESVAAYNNVYFEIVITIFMFLFGINFNIFYLILIRQGKLTFKNQEIKWYLGIIIIAIIIITFNTLTIYNNLATALRHSSFQVMSMISSSGFTTTNYNLWPSLSKWVLILLMISGGCAGSTSGGVKVSRISILAKSIYNDTKRLLHPQRVSTVKFEGRAVEKDTINGIYTFIALYFSIILIGTLILSIFDNFDLLSNLTAIISALGNTGPGLNIIGPMNSFNTYSSFSKIFLTLIMLAGRLELIPILMLFSPVMWKRI